MWSDSLPLPPDLESPAFGSFSFRRSLPLRLEPLLRLPAGDRQGQGGGCWRARGASLAPPAPLLRLTFTVLTAGAAPAVAVPQLREAWVRVVGVRGRRILVGESHGPRGSPRVRQRGQSVLVRGTAGAVVIVEGQVGHVCGGQERAGCWDSPLTLHLASGERSQPRLDWMHMK